MKIFNIFALSILLALLAACGDESSSSVSPEPRQCEEQSEGCDDTSSSSGEVSKNSSSSQKSADKGKSSSSEKNAKESSSSTTTKNSSSSVGGDKSSSSVKKEDSSSSAVKESSSSATPKSSSSEEVKQSSSSIVASSSSVDIVKSSSSGIVFDTARFCTPGYAYCDRDLGADSLHAGAYKKFTDARNGRSYYYLTINGKDKDGNSASVTVMAENLNIGAMVDGKKEQDDDSKIERYCYDNDTTNCDKYGGLYQWAEMMQLPSRCNTKSCADLIKPNHQGICPKGWRLLAEDDFYIILHADGNRHGAEDVRATSFGGYNYSGYSLLGGGDNWDYSFDGVNDEAYWLYPVESDKYPDEGALAGYTTRSLTTSSKQAVYKKYGFSVRCVMVE